MRQIQTQNLTVHTKTRKLWFDLNFTYKANVIFKKCSDLYLSCENKWVNSSENQKI